MSNKFSERDGEWIPSLEFRVRLSISRPVYLDAIKTGRIVHEIKEGKEYIEYIENRRKFVETAKDPIRYTEEAIAKRHKQKLALRSDKKELKTAKIRKLKGLPPLDRHVEMGLVDEEGSIHSIVKLANGVDLDNLKDPSDKEFRPEIAKRESEAIKQLYLAKQAKLKFLKEASVLMETQKVKEEWEAIAIAVRKSMLGIVDRVVELYASMTDSNAIRANLTKEIQNSLSNLKWEVDRSNGKKIHSQEEI